jgi:hypothetical protein
MALQDEPHLMLNHLADTILLHLIDLLQFDQLVTGWIGH